jgi:hypothetical protein
MLESSPKIIQHSLYFSPEVRLFLPVSAHLNFGRNLQRQTSFIEFVRSSTLRNGPSAILFLFRKITFLIAW